MTLLLIVLIISLIFAALALVMTCINLVIYRKPPAATTLTSSPLITICIPARNEEANIEACVRSVLASTHSNLEVVVYDDQSTDSTPSILAQLMASDSRVRAGSTVPLPAGWNGKQHACWRMSQDAKGDWLVFTDADVRFEPGCISRALAAATILKAELISTFPRQITGSLSEALAVPMIFFVLFSYLPMGMMRNSNSAAASAGCGQFLMITRKAYNASGGHASFKDSMHDGVKMPREARRAGFHSDLFDGTDLISVRMYRGFSQTWRGFAKNAFEGLGSLGLLLFFTFAHLLAHILPWIVLPTLLICAAFGPLDAAQQRALLLAGTCVVLNLFQRMLLSYRFRQGVAPVLLHPIGVLMMTAIQWHSYYLARTNQRAWRGRVGVQTSAAT